MMMDEEDLEKYSMSKRNSKVPLFLRNRSNNKIREEMTCRGKIFDWFDDPSTSVGAQLFALIVLVLIFVSCVAFAVETLPRYRNPGPKQNAAQPVFNAIETVCIIVFSVEYFARLLTVSGVADSAFTNRVDFSPNPDQGVCSKNTFCGCCRHTPNRPNGLSHLSKVWLFIKSPMNMIDLLSILPFFIEIATGQGQQFEPYQVTVGNQTVTRYMEVGGDALSFNFLRILRLARIFRVFKLGKYSEGLQLFVRVLAASTEALILLSFFVGLTMMLFGSMIFFAEGGKWDPEREVFLRPDIIGAEMEETPFTSIPASFWWVVTTTTTVGYGDLYPTSVFGKTVAVVTMHLGIILLALPITIIGSNFAAIYSADLAKKAKAARATQRALERSASRVSETKPLAGGGPAWLQNSEAQPLSPQSTASPREQNVTAGFSALYQQSRAKAEPNIQFFHGRGGSLFLAPDSETVRLKQNVAHRDRLVTHLVLENRKLKHALAMLQQASPANKERRKSSGEAQLHTAPSYRPTAVGSTAGTKSLEERPTPMPTLEPQTRDINNDKSHYSTVPMQLQLSPKTLSRVPQPLVVDEESAGFFNSTLPSTTTATATTTTAHTNATAITATATTATTAPSVLDAQKQNDEGETAHMLHHEAQLAYITKHMHELSQIVTHFLHESHEHRATMMGVPPADLDHLQPLPSIEELEPWMIQGAADPPRERNEGDESSDGAAVHTIAEETALFNEIVHAKN